jgi:hypothetical protein
MVFPFPQKIVLTPSAGLADCDKLFEQRRSPQIPRTARAIEVNRPTVHKQPARFHPWRSLCKTICDTSVRWRRFPPISNHSSAASMFDPPLAIAGVRQLVHRKFPRPSRRQHRTDNARRCTSLRTRSESGLRDKQGRPADAR